MDLQTTVLKKRKRRILIEEILMIVILVMQLVVIMIKPIVFNIITQSVFYILASGAIIILVTTFFLNIQKNKEQDLVYLELSGKKNRKKFYEYYDIETYTVERKSKIAHLFSVLNEYILIIVLALLFVSLLFTFVAFPATVQQHSMENTLTEGDKVVVLSREIMGKINDGDIIIFNYDNTIQKKTSIKQNDMLIKRIIASPGDTFYAFQGKIFVNGKQLTEEYVDESNNFFSTFDVGTMVAKNNVKIKLKSPSAVPEGYYVVLGDNRKQSNDSEELGLISQEQIIGKVSRYKHNGEWIKLN